MKLYYPCDSNTDYLAYEPNAKYLDTLENIRKDIKRKYFQGPCVIEYELVEVRRIPVSELVKEWNKP
jgi:hypothetical protein